MKTIRIKYLLQILSVLSMVLAASSCGGSGGDGGRGADSSNSTTLTWDAPTINADGTALTGLAGYKIYYGTSTGSYTTTVDAGNFTTYTVPALSAGTYYFAVTAYDTSGNESNYSNEVNKAIP